MKAAYIHIHTEVSHNNWLTKYVFLDFKVLLPISIESNSKHIQYTTQNYIYYFLTKVDIVAPQYVQGINHFFPVGAFSMTKIPSCDTKISLKLHGRWKTMHITHKAVHSG